MAETAAEKLVRRHPLQRLDSPSRGASAALHVLGLASFAYSFAFLVINPNPMYAYTTLDYDRRITAWLTPA